MKRMFLLLVCAGLAFGQAREERGKRVVMEALAALGGERFLAMQDRVEVGRAYSFYRGQVSGLSEATIYTRYSAAAGSDPGQLLQRERQSFTEKEKEISAVLFTGGQGYEITFRGARPLPEETLERYTASTVRNVFYILRTRLNEPGMVFESKGMDVWMNQPVEIVDFVDASNEVVTVYFHQSTKFSIRQVYFRRNPKTRERIEEVTEYGKFRDVGEGVYWPLTVLRTRDQEKIYQMFAETVTINQNLSDSLFTLPSDIKMLKPL